MTLADSLLHTEGALRSALLAKRGICDSTGKGSETELTIESQLLRPYLPKAFDCLKGAVVSSTNPAKQSSAIDRIIYDSDTAAPLIYGAAHSIFPIECVAGVVEITMSLDASKLREDIVRMSSVKEMRRRRFLVPVQGSSTRVQSIEQDAMSARSFVIGLPDDPSWKASTIACALREIQVEVGGFTHVHGVYVIGIGFFSTLPVEAASDNKYQIEYWSGDDRLFRFCNAFRGAFQRWPRLPPGWTTDLEGYVQGTVLPERLSR